MTDLTDLKVGDIVHVRGEVTNMKPHNGAWYTISFDGQRDYALVTRDKIVHVERRQFKVGDRVQPDWHDSYDMKIIAIDGSFAWLKSHDPRRGDTRYTLSLDNLTLAETK